MRRKLLTAPALFVSASLALGLTAARGRPGRTPTGGGVRGEYAATEQRRAVEEACLEVRDQRDGSRRRRSGLHRRRAMEDHVCFDPKGRRILTSATEAGWASRAEQSSSSTARSRRQRASGRRSSQAVPLRASTCSAARTPGDDLRRLHTPDPARPSPGRPEAGFAARGERPQQDPDRHRLGWARWTPSTAARSSATRFWSSRPRPGSRRCPRSSWTC